MLIAGWGMHYFSEERLVAYIWRLHNKAESKKVRFEKLRTTADPSAEGLVWAAVFVYP